MTWRRPDDHPDKVLLVGSHYVMGCLACNPETQELELHAAMVARGVPHFVGSHCVVRVPGFELRTAAPGESIGEDQKVWWVPDVGFVGADGVLV